MANDVDYDSREYDDEYIGLWQDCPNCGHPYDEIDFEFQICHLCKFDASAQPIK